jgi:peptidoglycan/LPS O-acetylase OafA/YrhL
MNSNKTNPFGLKLNIKQSTLIETVSLLLVLSGILVGLLMPQSIRFSLWMLPSLAFLVFVFAYQKGAISRLLNNKILVLLGEASFSFYMVHGLVLWYVSQLHLSDWTVVVLSFPIAIVLSCFVFTIYEEPMRLKLKFYLENKILNSSRRKFDVSKISNRIRYILFR